MRSCWCCEHLGAPCLDHYLLRSLRRSCSYTHTTGGRPIFNWSGRQNRSGQVSTDQAKGQSEPVRPRGSQNRSCVPHRDAILWGSAAHVVYFPFLYRYGLGMRLTCLIEGISCSLACSGTYVSAVGHALSSAPTMADFLTSLAFDWLAPLTWHRSLAMYVPTPW